MLTLPLHTTLSDKLADALAGIIQKRPPPACTVQLLLNVKAEDEVLACVEPYRTLLEHGDAGTSSGGSDDASAANNSAATTSAAHEKRAPKSNAGANATSADGDGCIFISGLPTTTPTHTNFTVNGALIPTIERRDLNFGAKAAAKWNTALLRIIGACLRFYVEHLQRAAASDVERLRSILMLGGFGSDQPIPRSLKEGFFSSEQFPNALSLPVLKETPLCGGNGERHHASRHSKSGDRRLLVSVASTYAFTAEDDIWRVPLALPSSSLTLRIIPPLLLEHP